MQLLFTLKTERQANDPKPQSETELRDYGEGIREKKKTTNGFSETTALRNFTAFSRRRKNNLASLHFL